MKLKTAYGILAVVLFLIYLAPVVLKLREVALSVVVMCGVAMMIVDLWQSLKTRE